MIESVNNERVKYWAKLSIKKYQEQEGKFIVEGKHLVEEALKSGNLLEVISLNGNTCEYENTTYVSENVMKKITSLTTPPQIIGVVKMLESHEIKGNVLLLDKISNPGNLGTIIRSAVAFNIDTIVLGDDTVSMYNPKVLRATEGLIFHVNVVQENLSKVIEKLREDKYTIYSTNVINGTNLRDINFSEKSAIIIGNEGAGVSPELLEFTDEFIYIEMNEACESLNAGVATSIILYELNNKLNIK